MAVNSKKRMEIINLAAGAHEVTIPVDCLSYAWRAVGGDVTIKTEDDAVNFWTLGSGEKEAFDGEALRMIKGQVFDITVAGSMQIRYIHRYRTQLQNS